MPTAWSTWSDFQKGLVVFVVIIALGCTFGIQQTLHVSRQQQAEAADRRNQSCLLFERTYNRNALSITSTYNYLDSLSAAERKQTLNKFIIRLLPRTWQQAKDSRAPKYCDEPNVGLPEPAIKLPPLRTY